MGSSVARMLSVVGAAIVLLTMFGAGVASAKDPYLGKTYDEAAAAISGHNGTPVVSTVTGDQLSTGDCIVTAWHVSKFLNSQGKNDRAGEFLLSLNCNNDVAEPGHPGNSVMSPQGAQGKKDQQTAAQINKHPSWCHSAEPRLQYCAKLCKRTGLCEI
jgi:hypothetical protein